MSVPSVSSVPPPPPCSTTHKYGRIVLDISNSVLPREKLSGESPSRLDGLDEETELDMRAMGGDLIQLAGKLLRLPQVAIATGCVLFQRFFYAKSLVKNPFDVVAMACLMLACKIEESPKKPRDIINVFKHIRQVRSGKPITPMILDGNYVALKNSVIKAERRVLKELGFCVHVKHPHKIILTYLNALGESKNTEFAQMSWNFMNDSLRTDVFVRYPPDTIAVACIYLSARKLRIALPKAPAWFEVLGVEEDDIKDCCYRMVCLYNRKKPNQDELESIVEALKKKNDDARRAARFQSDKDNAPGTEGNSNINTPKSGQSPAPGGSPGKGSNGGAATAAAVRVALAAAAAQANNGSKRSIMDANFVMKASSGGDLDRDYRSGSGRDSRRKKHKRSRSRSPSYDRDYHRSSKDRKKGSRKRRSYTRSPSYSPHRGGSAKKHRDRSRYDRSRSRDRDYYGGGSKNGRGSSSGRHHIERVSAAAPANPTSYSKKDKSYYRPGDRERY